MGAEGMPVAQDYRRQIADALVQLSGVLGGLGAEEWATQSLCEKWTVRDVAGHIVWRVGSSFGDMIGTSLPMLLRTRMNPNSMLDLLARQEAEALGTEGLVKRMRQIAAERLAGDGRTGLTDLVETVVHAYDILQPLGVKIEVDPEISRRIALRGLPLAPRERRAVARSRRLVALDAGWSIGEGPTLDGSAQGIILYLYGRSPARG
jgi:uncharacterized protein (TIGR03083 family)